MPDPSGSSSSFIGTLLILLFVLAILATLAILVYQFIAKPVIEAQKQQEQPQQNDVSSGADVPAPSNWGMFASTDYPSNDIKNLEGTVDSCKLACDSDKNCNGFTFNSTNNKCYLKNVPTNAKPIFNNIASFYYKNSPPTSGAATPLTWGLLSKTNYSGYDLVSNVAYDVDACKTLCSNTPNCNAFVHNGTKCNLKNLPSTAKPDYYNDGLDYYYTGSAPSAQAGWTADFGLKSNTDYPGNDIKSVTGDVLSCMNECNGNSTCNAFVYNKSEKKCFLKNLPSSAVGKPNDFGDYYYKSTAPK